MAEPDPHRTTLDVYETRAAEWEVGRGAPRQEESKALGDRWRAEGALVGDLGCGPGWHLPALPDGSIALDGARAMLDLVPRHAPASPRVQADLRALPFARHSLDGAWAERSYVHLDRRACPLAWWDLHRALRVGATAHLGLFTADPATDEDPSTDPAGVDHGPHPGDDFPGRSFSLWDEALLGHVLEGAGFAVERTAPDPDRSRIAVQVRSERTLADTVGPGMRLLLVGLNPSLYAADAGVGFARPGNRAWPALLAAGLATVDRDPVHLLRHQAIGMSDLVKRATATAKELRPEEFRLGFERLDALCAWLRPGAVCVLGVTGWRDATGDRHAALGRQERTLGGRPVHVMPNPSGLNAHTSVADLADHLRAALELGAAVGPPSGAASGAAPGAASDSGS
ncbi:uracil-DNA glycosylase family protein [Dermatobacter hominis]|uniref:uracil-DNA glycosylase family protein n=1 Tax=Dermatobacter hominis TaxID=2884263 RepID=UPI001D0FC5A9|nr:uracil-DNA glycosylase family protein [Dermatobacter hominis]UDY36972.1 methyltransferase domain-containing protein [Dermatobacter hominis]